MTIKTLDSKGRISLGSKFAGQTVLIDDTDPRCITIRPAVVIPAEEAWLYKNETAIGLVRKGLAQARSGKLSDSPPDVDGDLEWLEGAE